MRSENTQCTLPVEAVSGNVLEYQIRYQLELAQKMLSDIFQCLTKRRMSCCSVADSILGGQPYAEQCGLHHEMNHHVRPSLMIACPRDDSLESI